MKIKFLHTIVCLLCASCLVTSCLDDGDYQEIEYSSDSSITAFAIDSIIVTQYIDSVTYGFDSLMIDTVRGAEYPFAIDQSNRLIYNVDSLPVGTDISKVKLSISYDGVGLFIVAEDKDTLWSDADSLDFQKPIRFKAMAMNGAYGYTYTARISVHQQEPDSMNWVRVGNCFAADTRLEKAVTLKDSIYVFSRKEDKIIKSAISIYRGSNQTIVSTTNLPDSADCTSAMVWGNDILMVAGSALYRSTDAQLWEKVETETRFGRLIGNVHSAYNNKVYAINAENRFMESADGIDWDVKEEVPASFPQSPLAYAVSPLKTNSTIEKLTVMGNNSLANDTATIVWSRLTTESTWGDYTIVEDAENYCPPMENVGMVYYNDQFYAFGGPAEDLKAFSSFYTSTDQGVTWKPVKKWMFFPKSFAELYQQADGHYSYVVDRANYIWFIFSGSGEVWKARINKMGFADYKK